LKKIIVCSFIVAMIFGIFAGLSVAPQQEDIHLSVGDTTVTYTVANDPESSDVDHTDSDSELIASNLEETLEVEPIKTSIVLDDGLDDGGGGGGDTTDPDPDPDDDTTTDWHPLGSNALNFMERQEIVFLGVDEDDKEDFNAWAWDDASNSYAQMKRWDNNDGASNPTMAAGDLDGDGAAELVFLGTESDGADLVGWVYDDANHNFGLMRSWTITDDHSKEPEVACGDIDGDGLAEIICISVDEDGEDINAWVWDDHKASYAELKHWDSNDNVKSVNVACDDVDGDGSDEIVFLGTKEGGNKEDLIAWVYDDKSTDFAELWYWYDEETDSDDPDVACGDIDGDGLAEIVVVSTDCGFLDEGDINGWAFDDAAHDFTQLKNWNANDNTRHPQVACGDVDGDAKDEIIFLGVENDGEDLNGWLWDDHDAGYTELKHWDAKDNTESPRVATGDIDLDGKDEILFLGTDKDGEDLNGWLWDDSGNDYAQLKNWDANDNTKKPVCVIADIDGDGVVVEYEGHHYESDTNKKIVAVMAAPPTEAGLTQNYGSSSSGFGSSYTSGSGSGRGFYQTFSIAFSWEVDIPLFAESSAGFRISQAFKRTKTTMTTYTSEIGSYSGYNENKVIYSTAKYDRYEYRIISDTYPDSGLAGTTFTIDVPISSNTYSETLEYFNAHNGDEPDINIFSHIPGMVTSYPSAGDRDILAPPSGEDYEYPLFSRDGSGNIYAMPVGQGTGHRSLKVDLATDTTINKELTVGAEFVGSAGFKNGPKMEITAGFGGVFVWETAMGESFCFEGCVGDIEDWGQYDSYHYSYGLFAYPKELDYYGNCYVLNYWVQDLGPSYNRAPVSYHGYVKNNANYAIPSARVDVKTMSDSIIATFYTDSNGYFNTINFPSILNGNYKLSFSKSGFTSKSITVDADEGSRSYDTKMTASSTVRVYGYVKDTYGYALGGAKVTIKAPNGVVLGVVTAASNGYYSIYVEKGLASSYRAQASFIGRSSSVSTVSSTAATRRDFTIRLPYVPAPDPFFFI
jgi:hypothetical protein